MKKSSIKKKIDTIDYHFYFKDSDGAIRGRIGFKPTHRQARAFADKYFSNYYPKNTKWILIKSTFFEDGSNKEIELKFSGRIGQARKYKTLQD